MILSYRDKRTRDFASGKRVKAFSGIQRAAQLKLDRLDSLFFGTSPQFWLNLQTLYDLRVAEQRAGRTIKALPKLKRPRDNHESHAAHA